MRTFYLDRVEDVSGVSGHGVVAEGVEFSDGICVLRWLTATPSTGMYASLEDLERIHGHDGRTRIVIEGEFMPEWSPPDPSGSDTPTPTQLILNMGSYELVRAGMRLR